MLDSVVTLPKTIAGCVSRAVTHIHHNFSIIKTISTGWWRRCAWKIGGTAPFPYLIEDEMAPPNPFMQSITNNYKNLL